MYDATNQIFKTSKEIILFAEQCCVPYTGICL
jgi:hypothetical protein